MRAGIALGANLGGRLRSLTSAREALFSLASIAPPFLSSSLYETEPVDCEEGARKFLNAVVEFSYPESTRGLLAQLQQIERELGRPSPHARNRSRTIDLDLLYHGNQTIDEPGLQLPHPRISQRRFVLAPLAELRPNLIVPGTTKTVQQLLAELGPAPAVVRSARQW